jgi:hypothetical protein
MLFGTFFDVKNLMKVGGPPRGAPPPTSTHLRAGSARLGGIVDPAAHDTVLWTDSGGTTAPSLGFGSVTTRCTLGGTAAALKRRCDRTRLRLPGCAFPTSTSVAGEDGRTTRGIPLPRRWRSSLRKSTGQGLEERASARSPYSCQHGNAGAKRSFVDLGEEQSPWKDRVLSRWQRRCGTTDSSAEQGL